MTSKSLAKVLYMMCLERGNADATINLFMDYAKRKHLLYKIPHVLEYFWQIAQTEKTGVVRLTLPYEISVKAEKEIAKFIEAPEEAPIEKRIDKKIIGGFVAEYNNFIFEGSLRNQLKRLKEVLIQN